MDNVVINITELPNNVSFQIIEGGGGMQCADLAACQTIIDIEADLNTVASDLAAHESNTSNPHNVTKAQVGLSNVDNTSDINKPVSTAQQTALNLKVQSVTGPQVDDTDPNNPVVNTPTLQEVTDEGASTTNAINAPQYSTSGGEVTITDNSVIVLDNASTGNLLEVDRTTDSIKKLGVEIATVNDLASYLPLAGGSLSGALNEAKGANIASATTTDLSTATGNLVHITGTTTITSFGTVQAGTKIDLVFDNALILTNSANIILPNSLNIQTAANDIAELVSEGGGVWRLLRYQRYNDSWKTYSPTLTGWSVVPTGFTARYILNGKTCMISFNSTGSGTSNATSITMTLPFVAASIDMSAFPYALDNGTACTAGGITTAGSNVINILKNGTTSWTSSGSKRVFGIIIYQIQ